MLFPTAVLRLCVLFRRVKSAAIWSFSSSLLVRKSGRGDTDSKISIFENAIPVADKPRCGDRVLPCGYASFSRLFAKHTHLYIHRATLPNFPLASVGLLSGIVETCQTAEMGVELP
jgi:hypothetical protein